MTASASDGGARTAVEILRAARERIADQKHWCQGAFATRGRRPVKPAAKSATRWCAVGAIHAEQGTDPFECGRRTDAFVALWNAAWVLYGLGAQQVNDLKGHAAVLSCFDEAIAGAGRPLQAWVERAARIPHEREQSR